MAQEEEARLAVEQAKKKADQEVKELKKDIDELEIAVSKVIKMTICVPGWRFTNTKTYLLTGTLLMKNSTSRENCESRPRLLIPGDAVKKHETGTILV